EGVAVRELHAIVDEAEFRAERGRAAHGGIHVQPEIVVAADAANFADGVHRSPCDCWRTGLYARAPPAGRRARRSTQCPESPHLPRCWSKEISPAGPASVPANRARAFQAPCKPDWWTRACPARPVRKKQDRQEWPAQKRSPESRRRSWATASA